MARFQKGHAKAGGRQPGTPNKVTVQRALGIEQAERASGRKLAIERLAEAMEYWFGLAGQYQPVIENAPNPKADPKEFRACLKEGTTCARDLAPYQSPKLQSTTIRQDVPQEPLRIEVKVVR